MDSPTAVLLPHELAARWGKSVKTLANERSRGEGPAFVRVSPRRVVYPLAAVLAWEAAHLAEPQDGAA